MRYQRREVQVHHVQQTEKVETQMPSYVSRYCCILAFNCKDKNLTKKSHIFLSDSPVLPGTLLHMPAKIMFMYTVLFLRSKNV